MDNAKLLWENKFTYLGYTLQNSQKYYDEQEIENRVRNLKTIGNVLSTRLKKRRIW